MLGHNAVIAAIAEGKIVVDPFVPKHLGPNSLDLRLGDWCVRQRSSSNLKHYKNKYSLLDPIDPSLIWNEPTEIPDGILMLRPGELVLAHTMERVGTYEDIAGELSSRSSMMRMGIAVCVDAGLGDVGYDSKWTLEIYNHTSLAIGIPVGARVCQMKFHRVENSGLTYQEKGGTYGSRDDWKPSDMLPRSSLF
jgi:dCTP deaminase